MVQPKDHIEKIDFQELIITFAGKSNLALQGALKGFSVNCELAL